MNVKENMYEVRFPNIYILSPHIIYYVIPLTIIIALAIKAVDLDKLSVPYLQSVMVISKTKYDFFYSNFWLFWTKKFITSLLKRWNKKHKNI